jgi:precorrin-8X/cobalt-precorrin-8 methylmutase
MMNNPTGPTGILIVSHGSPRTEANERFGALAGRIAARLGAENVLPAFFSIARPSISDRVAELAARGVTRIVLLPYFLYAGQHATHDIPALVEQCRRQFPAIALEVLPTLEGDPALEDAVVERLTPVAASAAALPALGKEIQRRSHQIIARQLDAAAAADTAAAWGAAGRRIVERIVHATADFSFARSLHIHPEAVERGRAALAAGQPIFCDVKMLQAGITKVRNEVVCAIGRPEVAALAQQRQCTRAAAAMEWLTPRLAGAIVAVGNAPTALRKLLEIVRGGGPRPALVVGLPVGLVGAREAKLSLLESDLCYITNTTARGGSPVAAAAVNALATLEEEQLS